MSIGKIGGGKKGSGVGKTGNNSGKDFGSKIDRLPSSGGVNSVGAAQAVEPMKAQALEIAKQLKAGLIKSKEEATQKLVSLMLRERVRMQSRALASKISQTLQDDPRLNAALERLWANVE